MGRQPLWAATTLCLAFSTRWAAWGVVGEKVSVPHSHPRSWRGGTRGEVPKLMLKLLKACVGALLLSPVLQRRG